MSSSFYREPVLPAARAKSFRADTLHTVRGHSTLPLYTIHQPGQRILLRPPVVAVCAVGLGGLRIRWGKYLSLGACANHASEQKTDDLDTERREIPRKVWPESWLVNRIH